MNKFSRLLLLAVAATVASSANAFLIVSGNTTGSFSWVNNPGGLTFVGGSFTDAITTDGTTYVIESVGGNSIGHFNLVNAPGNPDNYDGAFDLTLNFTLPATSPSGALFTSTISGAVTTVGAVGNSTVRIEFADDDGVLDGFVTRTFDFIDASTGLTGVLTFRLDTTYTLSRPVSDTALAAELSAVPGPGAVVAFVLGAMANVRRRRSKRA